MPCRAALLVPGLGGGRNHNAQEVMELSSHQCLRREGAFLANYFAVTHPSGPNYRAMAAGRYWTNDERLISRSRPSPRRPGCR